MMTVIATTISQFCTVHATDSFITRKSNDGNHEVFDRKSTKIIQVSKWSGMMSIFGLTLLGSQTGNHIDLRDFLRKQVEFYSSCSGPQEFAEIVAEALNRLPATRSEGVGIHFTAYEEFNDVLIPELFQITNFTDTSYKDLAADGVTYRRETYEKIKNQWKDSTSERTTHGQEEFRQKVHWFLTNVGNYIYNNGDPALFNMSLSNVKSMMNFAQQYDRLRPMEHTVDLRSFTTWPVEQIAKFQESFFRPGMQIVGGDMHNLSVTPLGKFESDTGDVLTSTIK